MEEIGLTIHTDGGSRGNPGPAACAFVVSTKNEVIFEGSKYLGNATNNIAEYSGVLLALKWLSSNTDFKVSNSITFVLDSELVVRQLNGIYKVKDENLKKLCEEIKNIIKSSNKKIIFKNVRREENKEADLLVNQTLDSNSV